MRTAGILLGLLMTTAARAAAQTPPASLPVAGAHVYGGKSLVPATVACTDLPTPTVPMPPLRILSPHRSDLRQSATRDDLVVLNAGTPQGLAVGQRYFTRRVKSPLNHREISPADLGAIRTTGWLTVVAADERFALARIDFACVAVEVDDYLEPYAEPTLPEARADGPPNFSDMSRVLFGVDRHEVFGNGDLLSIDRGQNKGMTVGTRVAFYRDRQIGTPLFELGAGIVIEVSAETSKVAVERGAAEIVAGDYVVIRRVP